MDQLVSVEYLILAKAARFFQRDCCDWPDIFNAVHIVSSRFTGNQLLKLLGRGPARLRRLADDSPMGRLQTTRMRFLIVRKKLGIGRETYFKHQRGRKAARFLRNTEIGSAENVLEGKVCSIGAMNHPERDAIEEIVENVPMGIQFGPHAKSYVVSWVVNPAE